MAAAPKAVPAPSAVRTAAEQADLIFVSDTLPGISRRKRADGFSYVSPDGAPIRDAPTLERIRSLAIPPAYGSVWICPLPNGHLQATGIDARGRKQYRYHPAFREHQEGAKFERMLAFGQALPRLRERLQRDLALAGLPKDKVLATVIGLLERSFIRVGNEEYRKSNGSFGLTTLRTRHVKIEGARLRFSFKGKSGVRHDISVTDRRLARLVRQIQDLPGQELFHYIDSNGAIQRVSSADVNAYMREACGESFTAKDFRTWAGTVLALACLALEEAPASKRAFRERVGRVIRQVAAQLGNTPTICRKCYVHPAVLKCFEDGSIESIVLSDQPPNPGLSAEESAVMRLLARAGLDPQP